MAIMNQADSMNQMYADALQKKYAEVLQHGNAPVYPPLCRIFVHELSNGLMVELSNGGLGMPTERHYCATFEDIAGVIGVFMAKQRIKQGDVE